MLLSKFFVFTRTIRFRLTLLYSSMLFLVSTVLVLSLNIYLDLYLKADPIFVQFSPITINRSPSRSLFDEFNKLKIEERLRIRDIRLNDLKEIQNLSLMSLAPIAVVSFVLGYALTGRFLQPIDKLAQEIRDLSTKDLGKTIPVEVDDEVGQLIHSFNDLSSRLKEGFHSQERFVQDASHELKTPLTIIQTNLDTILDDPKATREELKQAIENALQGMKSLRNLTNTLLELSSNQILLKKDIPLNSLITKQTDALKEFALQNGVKLTTRLEKDVILKCDDPALSRAFFNLIENAIKYSHTNPNPNVIIESRTEKKIVLVSIKDNGPGIPEKSLTKIFDRFYQIDPARNKANGGFGLGLAITKKVIENHKGRITVTSKPGETVFTVKLPMAS